MPVAEDPPPIDVRRRKRAFVVAMLASVGLCLALFMCWAWFANDLGIALFGIALAALVLVGWLGYFAYYLHGTLSDVAAREVRETERFRSNVFKTARINGCLVALGGGCFLVIGLSDSEMTLTERFAVIAVSIVVIAGGVALSVFARRIADFSRRKRSKCSDR